MGRHGFYSRALIAIFLMSILNPHAHAAIERPDQGQPLSARELSTATNDLIGILRDTNYFDFVDSRIHGWPESSPQYPYWGTFWSGVEIQKRDGRIRYVHGAQGSDNNGISTSPYLEGACYANVLWGDPGEGHVVQRILRGMSGWILSSSTSAADTEPKVLNRAFYPESVHSSDNGREIDIDYDAARHASGPAIPTSFVHLPQNAFFGDIFIKNDRSCDDLGQMIRSLSLVEASCGKAKDLAADVELAKNLYARWAEDVDSHGFDIPTLDLAGNYLVQDGKISRGYTYRLFDLNPLCVGTFAVRMLHSDSPEGLECGRGVTWLEKLFRPFLKNDVREILRSHHEAAIAIAKLKGLEAQADQLSQGLVERIQADLAEARKGIRRKKFNPTDVPMLLIAAANVGIPLTSDEIRWLHGKLHETRLFYAARKADPVFHIFEPGTPDGTYSYDPPDSPDGIYFKVLGMLLGSCASPYRDRTRPVLDCDLLKNAFTEASLVRTGS